MAPKDRKGKSTDYSTAWSDWIWDDQENFYYASRYNPAGELEYDYQYPEVPQAPQAPQSCQDPKTIPRSPGPNVIQDSVDSSSSDPSNPNVYTYTTAKIDSNTDRGGEHSSYTANPTYFKQYDDVEEHTQPSHGVYREAAERPSSSGAESIATLKYTYSTAPKVTPAASTYTSSGAYSQNVSNSIDNTTLSFQGMTINPPSEYSEYSQQPYEEEAGSTSAVSHDSGGVSGLNSKYKQVEPKQQRKFWKVGRVFIMLWTEPAREGVAPGLPGSRAQGVSYSNSSQVSQVIDTYLGGKAFTEIRRFVILQEGHGNSICSPIHTYNGQATLKPNLPDAKQHAIIYTSSNPPDEYWYKLEDGTHITENLTKDPIAVLREQKGHEGNLGDLSRLNYSKIYTVEHYVKVLNIGMVRDHCIPSLLRNSMVRREDPIGKPRHSHKGKGKGKSSRS